MAIGYQVEGALTQEARDRFERDGFLVVDDPCSLDLVQSVRSDAESLLQDAFDTEPDVDRDGVVYTRHPGGTERFHWHRVREAWKIKSSIREMALSPRVLSLAGELFGRQAVPFQTLNFPMGTQQPPHDRCLLFQLGSERFHVRLLDSARGHGYGKRAAGLLPGQSQASLARVGHDQPSHGHRCLTECLCKWAGAVGSSLAGVHRLLPGSDRAAQPRAPIRHDPSRARASLGGKSPAWRRTAAGSRAGLGTAR